MTKAFSISLPLLLLMGFSACASKSVEPDRVTTAVAAEPTLQDLANQARLEGKMPALGVLLRRDGQDVLLDVQGRRAIQIDVAAQTSDEWHLGSDTKAMTAFLIALAVQEKRLTYETKVTTALKTNAKVHRMNRDLKITDLLVHQSALRDVQDVQEGTLWRELFQSTDPLRKQRRRMVEASLTSVPFEQLSEPGPDRRFRYGNINYLLLGAILEQIYNRDWESLITEKLFEPLEMMTCGFGVSGSPDETSPSQPWPHVMENGELVGVPPKYKLDNPAMLGPAGTVHCSLADWQKFIDELTATWAGRGHLVKSAKIRDRYFQSGPEGVYTYGGWGRDNSRPGQPLFWHNGSNTFNYAVAGFAPECRASVLLTTNTGQPEADKSINELRKKFIDKVLVGCVPRPKSP